MKIVKAQMLVAPGGNRKFVGTDWIAIFKKDCDRDVRVFFRCVEDAAGLVTGHLGGQDRGFAPGYIPLGLPISFA